MAVANAGSVDHLVWKRTTVEGRTALYGVAGTGPPVIFVHGWALGQHSYKRALKRLVHLGCRVYAPALPGFGGTPDLPDRQFSFAGYGEWLEGFVRAVGITRPVYLIGHSFGGGVSIQFAHDYPERVKTLVLINSVGGAAWHVRGGKVLSMAERPLWDWGLHFSNETFPLQALTRSLPVILEDALPNVVRNPLALLKVGNLVRRADLTPELEELRRRQLPVLVLWGEHDGVIPRESFDALSAALGAPGEVLPGTHNWMLADPDAFGQVMTNIVAVADLAKEVEADGEDEPPGEEVDAPTGSGGGRRWWPFG